LAVGLRPNPLGELTALPQTSWLDSEGRGGMGGRGEMGKGDMEKGEGKDGEGEGRDRPAHFLVASAAYAHCGIHCANLVG